VPVVCSTGALFAALGFRLQALDLGLRLVPVVSSTGALFAALSAPESPCFCQWFCGVEGLGFRV
jgi:hypothetical protein